MRAPATPERHVALLCGSCQGPMSRQEVTCWKCGARVRSSSSYGGSSRCRRTRRAPHPRLRAHSSAAMRSLRPGSARRRAAVVAPPTDRVAAAGRSRADDHARWQRERTEARSRTNGATRELAAAIAAGDARCRRLHQDLDDYGTRLEAVRVRLVKAPRSMRSSITPAPTTRSTTTWGGGSRSTG
jgi:hypothetical protein